MVGASSRLFYLLTNPSSLLHQRPVILFRLARHHSTTLSAALNHHHHLARQNPLISTKFSATFCSGGTNYAFQEYNHISDNNYHVPPAHPWPEWSRLIETLSSAGYCNGNSNFEDEFMENENLSKEFVAAANSCLTFARDRPEILGWLPKKDVEVIIKDRYPFLFKNAHETERRMRTFLQIEGSNEATSVDLMKYILSYASNPERNIKEDTESSVRSLVQEILNLYNRGRASEQYEQMPRNHGPKITMKRGDWICPKCDFMNFARNTKCLECEELRPQGQMTDGEWNCPRCDYLNYRRNVVCLKCDCRRPNVTQSNSCYVPNRYTRDPDKQDKTERWFKKVKELHGVKNDISHDFPQAMPISKEENNLLDKKYKDQPLPPYQGSTSTSGFIPFPRDYFAKKDNQQQPNSTNSTIKQTNESSYRDTNNATFDKNVVLETRNHGVKNVISHDFPQAMPISKEENHHLDNKFKDQPFPPYQASTSTSGFIPFPPDYFAKKDNQQQPNSTNSTIKHPPDYFAKKDNQQQPNSTNSTIKQTNECSYRDTNNATFDKNIVQEPRNQFRTNDLKPETTYVARQPPENMNTKSGWTGKSLEGSAVTEPDPLDMSEEAKAERWFKRVAQIKDISELSQIPDEDFPSIMPMRKGVNRFVVSKRKTPLERRLTSPQYRKNLRIMNSDPMKKEGNNDD